MSEPKNFFAGNKFKFTMTGERFKDNEFDLMTTGCNAPGPTLGVIMQGTPAGRQLELPGDSITFGDFTLEFIVSEDLTEYKELFQWIYDLKNFEKTYFDNRILADGTLVLLTSKNNPNIGFKMTDMYPYALSDIPLSLNTTEGEPIVATCSFKYINLEFLTDL